MQLKNRNEFVPGGFAFHQPETDWHAPGGSFRVVVEALIRHRLGNAYLVKKHGWNTDFESVADEVDAYVSLNLSRNPAYAHFLTEGGGPITALPKWRSRVASGVAAASKTVAGIRVLLRWLGDGGRAVEKPVAEQRASVCVQCPLNEKGDWQTKFTETASAEILQVFGIMNDMKLSTSHDGNLGLCGACGCPMRSKVWTPLAHIVKEMKPEVKEQLNKENPVCWVLAELNEIPI